MDGRTALVTGAAQGLGEAIARALAARGANVVVTDVELEGAEAVAADLGEHATALALDVRERASFERAFGAAIERFGRVDVLVNNAARTVLRPFWEIDDEEWDDVLATNLRSVFIGCQIAGPHMREHGFGRIVNLASLAGQQGGTVAGAHYAAAKAGIIVLTKIVARELAPHGVTVNAIAPAAVRTPVLDALPPERVEALAATIPVGRVGRPEEVAAVAAFLASDDAGYVTGATWDVNGGLFMR
ncbi:MAG: SDR family oxidoreductase [Actinobacteria bacterium]|nr:SDR family oxidoreductase [Actinomycetota bacterium]